MDYNALFEHFWQIRGRYLTINNPQRFYEHLCEKVKLYNDCSNIDDFVLAIDESIITSRNPKESTRMIMEEFYKYMKEKEGVQIDSEILGETIIDDPLERRLEMVKYMYKPRTFQEIQDHFHISPTTRQIDLNSLENGLKVFGVPVRICKKKQGTEYFYESTLHPVFLPLNLSEVAFMTKGLKEITVGTPYSYMVDRIIKIIKMQLSDYAFDRLFEGEDRPDINNAFWDEREMIEIPEGERVFILKGGQFSFSYHNTEYSGHITTMPKDNLVDIEVEGGPPLNDINLEDIKIIYDSIEYR